MAVHPCARRIFEDCIEKQSCGESREHLVDAVFGLALQYCSDRVRREVQGPAGIAVDLAKMLIEFNLCDPVQLEMNASEWPTWIKYESASTPLTWTIEAKKYF